MNDALYDFTGWFWGIFLKHRGKFWDDGREFSSGGEHLFYKMMFGYKYALIISMYKINNFTHRYNKKGYFLIYLLF